jgi:hypothetical protein
MDNTSQQELLYCSYNEHIKDEEHQRLALLDERISRKELILKDVRDERRKILMRIIKRARRAEGKS